MENCAFRPLKMYLEYLDALTYSAMLADHQVHVTPVGCLQNAVTRVVFKDGNFCFYIYLLNFTSSSPHLLSS